MAGLTMYDIRVKEIYPGFYGVFPLTFGDPIGIVAVNNNAVVPSDKYLFLSRDGGHIARGANPDLAVVAYLNASK